MSVDHGAGLTEEITVLARLGTAFGDDDAFERQRRAVVRAGLAYDPEMRVWRGRAPLSMNSDADIWTALVEAVTAGTHVVLESRD